jgi:DNA-binding beta-propeller fold protein YncE
VRAIGVGDAPVAFCHNPQQNRVYVANYGSSTISVLRDSAGGVEETPNAEVRTTNAATVVRGLPAGAVAFDAMGRRVVSAKAGVYFVRDEGRGAGDVGWMRKVVVQH